MSDTPMDDDSDASTDELRSLTTPHSSTTWKVLGEIDDPTGIGVLGHNTATSGQNQGIKGVADSPDDATGVLGEAPNGGSDGVIGIAKNGGIGVGGLTDSADQAGMLAINIATSGVALGLNATTDSGDDGSAGVLGEATAGSGVTYGVEGRTASPSGYGLYTPDDTKVGGVTELAAMGGSLTGGVKLTNVAGEGLDIDANGDLNSHIYKTKTFTEGDTHWDPISGLTEATPVEVTVDASDTTEGHMRVVLDDPANDVVVVGPGGFAHRILQPTTSVSVRSDREGKPTGNSNPNNVDFLTTGVEFKPDGTKMFASSKEKAIDRSTTGQVEVWDLSSAWTLNGDQNDGAYDISSETTVPSGLAFKTDGTKMFVSDPDTGTIYSYSLSTAWDVFSSTLTDSFDTSTQDPNPQGIAFKDDGSKLYLAGGENETIYSYTLSTAWDISTASPDTSFDAIGSGVAFSDDGTIMYLIGGSTQIRYDLSTAWDISSATHFAEYDISDATETARGMSLKPDRTKFYSASQEAIISYTLGYSGTAHASVQME